MLDSKDLIRWYLSLGTLRESSWCFCFGADLNSCHPCALKDDPLWQTGRESQIKEFERKSQDDTVWSEQPGWSLPSVGFSSMLHVPIRPVMPDGLAMGRFHAPSKPLSRSHTHTPCPLHSSVGSHCCTGSHFWAQRIGAACLAFLRLKVSTSSSTKTPIVPSRPRSLAGWKRSGVVH